MPQALCKLVAANIRAQPCQPISVLKALQRDFWTVSWLNGTSTCTTGSIPRAQALPIMQAVLDQANAAAANTSCAIDDAATHSSTPEADGVLSAILCQRALPQVHGCIHAARQQIGPVSEGVCGEQVVEEIVLWKLASLQGMMGSEEAEWDLHAGIVAAVAQDMGRAWCQ